MESSSTEEKLDAPLELALVSEYLRDDQQLVPPGRIVRIACLRREVVLKWRVRDSQKEVPSRTVKPSLWSLKGNLKYLTILHQRLL